MATGSNAGDEFGDDRETMQSGGVREIIVRVRGHDLQFIVIVSIYYIPVFACDAKMDLARIVIASLLALNNLALFSKVSAFVVIAEESRVPLSHSSSTISHASC